MVNWRVSWWRRLVGILKLGEVVLGDDLVSVVVSRMRLLGVVVRGEEKLRSASDG